MALIYATRLKQILALALLGFLAACDNTHPLPTASSVDLQKYQGTWYEIAMLPNRFQAMCVSDTTAQYQQASNAINVTNRCRKADGNIEEALGTAKVVDGSGNAKLRVSFFWPFYGDYWILALDNTYQWVLVGEPERQFGWVLARTPELDHPTLAAIMSKAGELGYDKSKFRLTPHSKVPAQ